MADLDLGHSAILSAAYYVAFEQPVEGTAGAAIKAHREACQRVARDHNVTPWTVAQAVKREATRV